MEAERATSRDRSAAWRNILGGVFQSNPEYELVLFDRLSRETRELFSQLRTDSEFYGILRPRTQHGPGIRSVDRDTALLLLTMREAGELPFFIREAGEPANREIARLVLDRILLMRHAGRMICGAAARTLLEPDVHPPQPETGLHRLSLDAMQYAARLPFEDPALLASRLEAYGRIPLSPAWRRRLPDSAALERLVPWPNVQQDAAWTTWRRNEIESGWQLYVSVQPDCFEPALAALVAEAARAGAIRMGRGAAGLLRPDHLIAHFARFEDLEQTATALLGRLRGCPPQGVPFTAAIETPLLSWSQGPDARRTVLRRVAEALLATRPRWRDALEYLRRGGIDTDSWTLPGRTC